MVVVKRPENANQNPEELLLGFVSTNPKTPDRERCIDLQDGENDTNFNTFVPNSNSDPGIALGAHPRVYSSAGSHHLYTEDARGFGDANGTPDCVIGRKSNVITYYPAATNSDITSSPIELLVNPACTDPCSWTPYQLIDVFPCGGHFELMGLIDIFDENEGLWVERTNEELFSQDTPLRDQRMLCSVGEGCDKHAPFAPWTGEWGLNPLEYVFKDFHSYNCSCDNPPANCEDFEVTECLYEYNPYLCEFYDIVMPGQFQYNGVCNTPQILDSELNLNA